MSYPEPRYRPWIIVGLAVCAVIVAIAIALLATAPRITPDQRAVIVQQRDSAARR